MGVTTFLCHLNYHGYKVNQLRLNTMLLPYKECPVPIDQQPRNEYNALRESSLFVLPTLSLQGYLVRLFYLVSFSLTFSVPLASTSVNLWKTPISFILLSISISSLLIILVLL